MFRYRWLKVLVFILFAVPFASADLILKHADLSIPDANAAGAASVLNTGTLSGTISSIEVSLKISGDSLLWAGDYYVSLSFDNGDQQVKTVLLNRVGKAESDPLGYDFNGFDLTFVMGEDDA